MGDFRQYFLLEHPWTSFHVAMGHRFVNRPDGSEVDLTGSKSSFDYAGEYAFPNSSYRDKVYTSKFTPRSISPGYYPFWDRERNEIFMHDWDSRDDKYVSKYFLSHETPEEAKKRKRGGLSREVKTPAEMEMVRQMIDAIYKKGKKDSQDFMEIKTAKIL